MSNNETVVVEVNSALKKLFADTTLNRRWVFVAVVLAQVVIGLVPVLTKLSQREISSNAVMFDRFWIGALFFALWDVLLTSRRQLFEKLPTVPEEIEQKFSATSLVGLLCLASFFLSVSLVIWAWSLTETSIANATLMHSILPVFTVLIGWLILGQRFDRIFILAMTVTIVGGLIIGFDDFQVNLRNQLNAATIVMRVSIIGVILNLPLLLIAQGQILPSSENGWLAVIGLGLTLTLGQGLMAYSLKQLSSEFVSLVSFLDPVFSASFAWLFLSEALSFRNLVGFAIILVGFKQYG